MHQEQTIFHGTPQDDQFLQQMAQRVHNWGLTLPVVLLLGAGQPFTFFAAQLLWVATPALSLASPPTRLRQLAHMLEQPQQTARFLTYLEKQEGG